MLSALERNSTEKAKLEGIETSKKDLHKSGCSQNILRKIKEKLSTGRKELQTEKLGEAITFPVFYFDDLNEFKKIIHNSKTDLQQLIAVVK